MQVIRCISGFFGKRPGKFICLVPFNIIGRTADDRAHKGARQIGHRLLFQFMDKAAHGITPPQTNFFSPGQQLFKIESRLGNEQRRNQLVVSRTRRYDQTALETVDVAQIPQ